MSRPRPAKSTVEKYLPVQLTEKELKEYRDALPTYVGKMVEAEAAHASRVKEEKDTIEALNATASGLAERGQGELLAHTLQEIRDRQEDLALIKGKHKGKILIMEADIARARRAINSGREFRQVDCEVEWNYRDKQVTTTRKDTGEVIDQRAMQPEETQERLPA